MSIIQLWFDLSSHDQSPGVTALWELHDSLELIETGSMWDPHEV